MTNPVQLEIFKSLFHAIAEEMGATLKRTAFSPNIKERRDYSCAIFDARGDMIAQGDHMPVHLGSMPLSVKAAIDADRDGFVEAVDALEIGLCAAEIGVGRIRKEDRVDPAAGFVIEAPVGARVRKGDPLVVVHARSQDLVERVASRVRNAWSIVEREVRKRPHIVARVDRDGVTKAG